MATGLRRRAWTAEEYHRIAEAGVLSDDDRVELIEGEIVEMSPIGRRHAGAVDVLNHVLSRQIGDRCIVRVQGPIRLSADSEPQPDVALLAWRDDFYRDALPTATDVVLVIEVADTSVDSDREVKVPAYGRAGVGEAWLVDLVAGVIDVYTDPTSSGYSTSMTYRSGDILSTAAAPDVAISVTTVIGG